MEHRNEIEELLLSGLPEPERRITLVAIANARAAELARLQRQDTTSTSGS